MSLSEDQSMTVFTGSSHPALVPHHSLDNRTSLETLSQTKHWGMQLFTEWQLVLTKKLMFNNPCMKWQFCSVHLQGNKCITVHQVFFPLNPINFATWTSFQPWCRPQRRIRLTCVKSTFSFFRLQLELWPPKRIWVFL